WSGQGCGARGDDVCLLTITLQEVTDAANGLLQFVDTWQCHDAEVIRVWPVERGALNYQQFFRKQQVEDEFFVVEDRAHLRVDARECIQRAHRLDAADAGNIVEQFPGAVALFQQAARRKNQVVDTLIAAQCSLNGVLARYVGTQAHVGQNVDAFDVALRVVFRPGNGDPAGTEARNPIRLGQTVEGQAQQVRCQRGGADVHCVVIENLVVDFVGEHHQIMLASQLQHAQQYLAGIHCAGRVIGVDDHHGLGVRRDFGLDVFKVWPPVGLLVAQIVHRAATGQGDSSGPQRIVGGRNQHFVAIVEQRLHRHHDQLGHAVAQVDVFDADAFDLLLLVILHHRLAGAEQALGVAVALRSRQVADHVLQDFVRRLEAKRCRVADVQLEDAMAFLFQAFGVLEHRPANVVADVCELVRFVELHGDDPENGRAVAGLQ
ncbi:hypothetical protein ALQ69_104060, partial [Pseudomonas savastanoi pv. glycinea]